eukprot:GHVQ01029960.1.p1 GENE.GHVQ01029960.1~~GHVQ01029960.1.p1  ORF type:complete len:300 (-),score=10.78 GHVQ01029960.1:297-1196(-)
MGFTTEITEAGLWPTANSKSKHTGYQMIIGDSPDFKNFLLAENSTDKVSEVLQKEVELGRMREATHQEIPYLKLCKLGAIPKTDSSQIRLIDDHRTSGLNERCVSQVTCQFPTLSSVALCILLQQRAYPNEPMVYCETDVEGAFRHVPVNYKDSLCLANKIDEKYYVHTKLCFGARYSPLQWVRVFETVQKIHLVLLGKQTHGVIYVDDTGNPTTSNDGLFVLAGTILLDSVLGVKPSISKMRLSTDPRTLGFAWNLQGDYKTYVPEEKSKKFVALIDEVLRKHRVSKDDIEAVCGKMC